MVIIDDVVSDRIVFWVRDGLVRGIGSFDELDFGWQIVVFEGDVDGQVLELPPGIVYVLRPSEDDV